MTRAELLEFALDTPGLALDARETPWDTAVFGFPVVQVRSLEVRDRTRALADIEHFHAWVTAEGVGIVSCRLAHERLVESMLLEAAGFRFVEMVLHPWCDPQEVQCGDDDGLTVVAAAESDADALQRIAEQAFRFERYHVDPRIDAGLGDVRYGRWVRNCLQHPAQKLLKVVDGDDAVAVFIVEMRADGSAYWHLTAIAPQWQGRGYGPRVWRAVLRQHRAAGCRAIVTTISARNTPVLNLYVRLGFRFAPPEMTFHWVRSAEG